MRHRLQCAYCGANFHTYRATQQTCGRSCAQLVRLTVQGAKVVARTDDGRESAARVEALWRAARDARLARERATGQRTFRVEDGWAQKAGRCCMDGEMRLSEVANGD